MFEVESCGDFSADSSGQDGVGRHWYAKGRGTQSMGQFCCAGFAFDDLHDAVDAREGNFLTEAAGPDDFEFVDFG